MTAATEPAETQDVLRGLRIIDCDAHFTEPPDLWTARAPASMRDRVPVQETSDGTTAWFLDGAPWGSTGGNTIQNGRRKVRGTFMLQPFEIIDPAAWAVKERLELLDEMGIYAQVLYPNGIGFASNHIFAIEDESDRLAILHIYNDYLVEVQTESKDRLFPQAMLPIWDMDLTLKEMTRLIDKGITGFTLSDKPEMLGLAELPDPYFEPMWDLFNESGAVANFHIASGRRRDEQAAALKTLLGPSGAQRGEDAPTSPAEVEPAWRAFGAQRRLSVAATQSYMSNVRIIANLCMSDLFDKHPQLKIVSAESGIGWVPFLLESLEWQYDEMLTDGSELAYTKRRPTEYFRDHIYVMFWFEKLAPQKMIEDIGINNVLVETDVPHPTCYYPGAWEHFAEVLKDLSPLVRRRVLQENAAELYKIRLPDDG